VKGPSGRAHVCKDQELMALSNNNWYGPWHETSTDLGTNTNYPVQRTDRFCTYIIQAGVLVRPCMTHSIIITAGLQCRRDFRDAVQHMKLVKIYRRANKRCVKRYQHRCRPLPGSSRLHMVPPRSASRPYLNPL